MDDVGLQVIQNDGGGSQLSLRVNDNNRELTLSDNNLHIKSTEFIGFTVCLLLYSD